MKKHTTVTLTACLAAMLAGSALFWQLNAADAKDPIKEVMKAYHKAPKGVDPVCKKAGEWQGQPGRSQEARRWLQDPGHSQAAQGR